MERFPGNDPEDIILLKLQWYKAGGETSERQWADVLSVIRDRQEIIIGDVGRSDHTSEE